MISLTRNDTGDVLNLPDYLRWSDEFDWGQLAQTTPQRTLSGAIIVQQGVKRAGRPITLSNSDSANWLRRRTVETLQEWAGVPDLTLQLDYHGKRFGVIFRSHDKAISAEPVRWTHDEDGNDYYHAAIYLLTV